MGAFAYWMLNGWHGIGLTFLLAFLLTFVLAKVGIPLLQKLKFGQVVRNDGPEKHLSKQGTPTMGGVIFVLGTMLAFWGVFGLIVSLGNNDYAKAWPAALFATLSMLGFGAIGMADDLLKIIYKNPKGLSPRWKILSQLVLSLALCIWADTIQGVGSTLIVPWLGYEWNLGWGYVPFMVVVLIAIINCVNLTDGLDGQSASITLIDVIAYILIFGMLINKLYNNPSLNIGANTAAVRHLLVLRYFLAAFAGSLLAYLVFNVYPARVFMGDTGSFAMGGALAATAVLSRTALIVPILGVCFVASGVSVILQVGSFKLRKGKRIFLMAPVHHHFELKGYPETKVVEGYRIVTTLACALALTAF